MAKKTTKFLEAMYTSKKLGVKASFTSTAEALYDTLESRGYWWNSGEKKWTNSPPHTSRRPLNAPAIRAPGLVEVRIVAADALIEFVCERVITQMKADGWIHVSISDRVYGMRDEDASAEKRGRAYLSFIAPTGENS